MGEENMKIGNKLKELRKERQLTLKTVANAINISVSAMSMYENDQIEPSLSVLKSILDFYCVNVEAFLISGDEYINISFYSEIGKQKALALHKEELKK